jgi:hypothetical protein
MEGSRHLTVVAEGALDATARRGLMVQVEKITRRSTSSAISSR